MTELQLTTIARDAVLAQMATAPIAGSVGEGGRSISYDYAAMLARLEYLNIRIAQLSGPFVITSTARAYP